MLVSAGTHFCNSILSLDGGIRFAGIANREAHLIEAVYRKDVTPLLTRQETEMSILQSLIRMGTRGRLEAKIGKTIYAFARYEKVKRVTIPLREGSEITHILLISFDIDADHDSIVMNKIIPWLDELVLSY